eukprot:scaffold743_cov310-Pavlova_lutheri.AAC.1
MRFVQNYSDIAAPLTELSRKQYKHDFQHYWKPQHDAAFTQLVQLLTSRPVLQLFHADRPIRIETDVSDHGMGAVLLQDVSTNQWKPVEFWSKNSILPRKTIIQQRKRPALSFMRSSIGVTYYLDNSFQLSPITGPACIFRASHQNN